MATAKREQYKIEIGINASPALLYNYISTPQGLSEWFADDVNPVKTEKFEFTWDGSKQIAKVVKSIPNKLVRYQWEEGAPEEYFEIEIMKDEITNDVALIITDFTDSQDKKANMMIWESQVHQLKENIGA
jgi:uncharacterized protein YndB with AHSA1/START domain